MEIQQFNHSPVVGDDLPLGKFVPHSRFTGIVNFINDQNQLVYITSNEEFLAANAMFLPGVRLSETSSLTVSSETIILDNISFDRKKMDIYDSDLHFEGVDFVAFESKLFRLPAYYSNLFPDKSLIFLINAENEKFLTSGFDQQFMLNAKKSSELILSGEIVKGIETIKGTGYGLTPSGDDFIAGFLLGLHYIECKYKTDQSALRDKIYHCASGSNLLTTSFLLNAKNRKYFRPLKKFLLLLGGETLASIRYGLTQLLSIGATSGADLFSGYMFPIKHKIGI